MKRIAIVGPVASGKTTLAGRLASTLELPAIDLDDYYWRQSRRPTDDEWEAQHLALISRDRWVVSGDYRAVAEVRFKAADVIVWLDLPRPVCLIRATRRKMHGNPAPLVASWRWIWRYRRHGRPETARMLAGVSKSGAVHRLRSSTEVASFLNRIEKRHRGSESPEG